MPDKYIRFHLISIQRSVRRREKKSMNVLCFAERSEEINAGRCQTHSLCGVNENFRLRERVYITLKNWIYFPRSITLGVVF